ncbi:hypothetical protein Tco_1233946 [Tanacetum coccineum]
MKPQGRRRPTEETLYLTDAVSVCLKVDLEPDEWIKDSGCTRYMTGNKSLFTTYQAYDGGNVVLEVASKAKLLAKVEESLNVIFDESPPHLKTSPLVDDDIIKSQIIENQVEEIENKEMDH